MIRKPFFHIFWLWEAEKNRPHTFSMNPTEKILSIPGVLEKEKALGLGVTPLLIFISTVTFHKYMV